MEGTKGEQNKDRFYNRSSSQKNLKPRLGIGSSFRIHGSSSSRLCPTGRGWCGMIKRNCQNEFTDGGDLPPRSSLDSHCLLFSFVCFLYPPVCLFIKKIKCYCRILLHSLLQIEAGCPHFWDKLRCALGHWYFQACFFPLRHGGYFVSQWINNN